MKLRSLELSLLLQLFATRSGFAPEAGTRAGSAFGHVLMMCFLVCAAFCQCVEAAHATLMFDAFIRGHVLPACSVLPGRMPWAGGKGGGRERKAKARQQAEIQTAHVHDFSPVVPISHA
jgi:hypothetical protein